MKKSALLLLLLCIPGISGLIAQTPEEKPLTGSMSVGIQVHTYGAGMSLQWMKYREKTDLLFGLNIVSFRNLKENKIVSAYADQQGKDYIWDKKNYLFTITPTFGISRELLGRKDDNRISVRGSLSAGPVLGLLKPYYIEIAVPISPTEARVEVAPYDASQYTWNEIVGEADFFLGLNEMKLAAGLRTNAAAMLDFSGSSHFIRAIEFGLFSDFYLKAPRILDEGKNKGIFVGGSLTFLVGNKF